MTERKMKRVADSYTTQVQLLTQANLNGYNRLFGGQLMSWMDIVAGVTARRHAEKNVTTVCVEELEFRAPARANDVLMLTGQVCYVGRTSMDVCVRVYVEELSGERRLINHAHFVMVALDEQENPSEVPGLILETQEDRDEWEDALRRRSRRS